jgi:hypothetical protein
MGGQIDAAQHVERPEAFVQVADLDDRWCGSACRRHAGNFPMMTV